MGFPQLSNIDKRLYQTIKAKAGNNLRVSKTMPWIRVISCLGNFLSIESSKETETFAQKYGNTESSGRLGIEYPGGKAISIYADRHNDRGLRPSPSIDSISVSQGNEGLSKKSSFTITCYSLGQCEKIMEYFLEPGKMVLVEWGENVSYSVTQKVEPVATGPIAAYNNLKHIQTKRTAAHGLYDAVLGVITGGSMSYGDNETYEVNVELTSIGEIPAYLQHHKGVSVSDVDAKQNTSDLFKPADIKNLTQKDQDTGKGVDANVGQALFMQMYNDLPAPKRSTKIKALNELKWVTNASNFVNFDKVIRSELIENIKNTTLVEKQNDGKNLEITSDVPLFSDKRFIKVALAFTILDSQSDIETESVESGVSNGKKTIYKSLGRIRWDNTICRAHKNMFSADSNYLYIPNMNSPNFDLIGAMSKVVDKEGSQETFSNPLPKLTGGRKDLDDTIDIHPNDYGSGKSSYFPSNTPLDFTDQACYDGSYVPLKSTAGDWGLLRNLYINFDFFCDTLKTSGLVTKDIYYILLNGMSSSVNLYWNFQIIPRGSIKTFTPDKTDSEGNPIDSKNADTYYQHMVTLAENQIEGQEELQIVDASFGGTAPHNLCGLAQFQSRGTNSPFLSAELNFDIPGAKKGQVTAQAISTSNPNPEDKAISLFGLSSDKKDTVRIALNSIKTSKAKEEAASAFAKLDPKAQEEFNKQQSTNQKAENKDQHKANYEFFVQNACVVPYIQDRTANRDMTKNTWAWGFLNSTSNDVSFNDMVKVSSWEDPSVLKKVQLYNDGFFATAQDKKNYAENLLSKNSSPLPIKFNFTIHGVSGIRVGDTFSIIDLPNKYNTRVFQVRQVSHDIAQNIWTTTIEGQMMNMKAGDGALLKRYNTK